MFVYCKLFWIYIMIINCISLFFFKHWLGPKGLFYLSILSTTFLIFFLFSDLYMLSTSGLYLYIDFGRWFFNLDLIDSHLVFIIDTLSLVSSLVVLVLSIFAQYFGLEYMYREAYINRLLYLLNFFSTSVIFLFFVFDFFLILIVWELIGLFSLLLVNFYATRIYTLKAALKTFIFSRFSDLFIFVHFLLIILVFNTSDLSILFIQIPFFIFYNIYILGFGFNIITILAVFLVFACSVKAAQFCVHVWLPDAMEAPTPASALIHSSTLVIMGIFLIIRFNIIFEFSYIANLLMALLGSLTIAYGALVASFQNDIKKLVAFSTISQMGYLFCGCGFLCYNEVLFYLIIHAFNKAFLFIIVGYIVHFFSGNTDLRFMGSLSLFALDFLFISMFISFNLTGLPYTAGFISKEFLLFQTFRSDVICLVIRSFWFVSFFLTPFYMFWLNLNVFFYLKLNSSYFYKHLLLSCYKQYAPTILLNVYLCFVTSRVTVFVLFIFFVIVSLFSEFILLFILNFITVSDICNISSWTTFSWFFFDMTFIFNEMSSYILIHAILVLVFSTIRLFVLVKNINIFN